MNMPNMNTTPTIFQDSKSRQYDNEKARAKRKKDIPQRSDATRPLLARQLRENPETKGLERRNLQALKALVRGEASPLVISVLKRLSQQYAFSIEAGELQILDGSWYVTHTGLLGLARRKRCRGIHVEAINSLSDVSASRYVMKATVYPSKGSAGFVGYGDADPSNVSQRVRGAEMRMAETRAVNRALRKAYGVGICSIEEIGSFSGPIETGPSSSKIPPKSTHGANGNSNGSGHKVRDRLCQIIRQHKLDPELVKAYAVDFCGTKELKEAKREQVETFVQQLAESAQKDRAALVCQLNSYAPPNQEVVA